MISQQLQILGNVGLAMLLGGLIGLEREVADKPAGLRTHMLVAATAALLVSLGGGLVQTFNTATGNDLGSDPIRIVQAIVMGIGFLGAGTIIQRRQTEQIEGLTTGASLMLVTAVGICVACNFLLLAVSVTLLTLLVLILLGCFEKWFVKKRHNRPPSS